MQLYICLILEVYGHSIWNYSAMMLFKILVWHLLVSALQINCLSIGQTNPQFKVKKYYVKNINQDSSHFDTNSDEQIKETFLNKISPRPQLVSRLSSQNKHQDSFESDDIVSFHKAINANSERTQKQDTPKRRKYRKRIPRYDFKYSIRDDNSGNNFGHRENRNGRNTQGSYFVNLPDGRRQIVDYYVNGKSGFVARVSYVGKAIFPVAKPTPSAVNHLASNANKGQQLKGYRRYLPKTYLPQEYLVKRPIKTLNPFTKSVPRRGFQISSGERNGQSKLRTFKVTDDEGSSSEEHDEQEDNEEEDDEKEEDSDNKDRDEVDHNLSFNQIDNDEDDRDRFQIPRFIIR